MGSESRVHRAFSNNMTIVLVRLSTDVASFGRFKVDRTGHFEKPPYNYSSMRSIYHIREYNVRRLSLVSIQTTKKFTVTVVNHVQLSSPDVFLSHDWPRGIEQHGDLNDLLRRKPFFRDDIQSNQLGSPPLMSLLHNLQPTWWFAAHLHTRFEARVLHGPPQPLSSELPPRESNPDEITISDDEGQFDGPSGGANVSSASVTQQNPDEITLDEEIETVERPPQPPRETRFLALDKCLPRHQFLEASPEASKTNRHVT